jgi:hypothetical protein
MPHPLAIATAAAASVLLVGLLALKIDTRPTCVAGSAAALFVECAR